MTFYFTRPVTRPDFLQLLKRKIKWCFNSFHKPYLWSKDMGFWEYLQRCTFLLVIISPLLLSISNSGLTISIFQL